MELFRIRHKHTYVAQPDRQRLWQQRPMLFQTACHFSSKSQCACVRVFLVEWERKTIKNNKRKIRTQSQWGIFSPGLDVFCQTAIFAYAESKLTDFEPTLITNENSEANWMCFTCVNGFQLNGNISIGGNEWLFSAIRTICIFRFFACPQRKKNERTSDYNYMSPEWRTQKKRKRNAIRHAITKAQMRNGFSMRRRSSDEVIKLDEFIIPSAIQSTQVPRQRRCIVIVHTTTDSLPNDEYGRLYTRHWFFQWLQNFHN